MRFSTVCCIALAICTAHTEDTRTKRDLGFIKNVIISKLKALAQPSAPAKVVKTVVANPVLRPALNNYYSIPGLGNYALRLTPGTEEYSLFPVPQYRLPIGYRRRTSASRMFTVPTSYQTADLAYGYLPGSISRTYSVRKPEPPSFVETSVKYVNGDDEDVYQSYVVKPVSRISEFSEDSTFKVALPSVDIRNNFPNNIISIQNTEAVMPVASVSTTNAVEKKPVVVNTVPVGKVDSKPEGSNVNAIPLERESYSYKQLHSDGTVTHYLGSDDVSQSTIDDISNIRAPLATGKYEAEVVEIPDGIIPGTTTDFQLKINKNVLYLNGKRIYDFPAEYNLKDVNNIALPLSYSYKQAQNDGKVTTYLGSGAVETSEGKEDVSGNNIAKHIQDALANANTHTNVAKEAPKVAIPNSGSSYSYKQLHNDGTVTIYSGSGSAETVHDTYADNKVASPSLQSVVYVKPPCKTQCAPVETAYSYKQLNSGGSVTTISESRLGQQVLGNIENSNVLKISSPQAAVTYIKSPTFEQSSIKNIVNVPTSSYSYKQVNNDGRVTSYLGSGAIQQVSVENNENPANIKTVEIVNAPVQTVSAPAENSYSYKQINSDGSVTSYLSSGVAKDILLRNDNINVPLNEINSENAERNIINLQEIVAPKTGYSYKQINGDGIVISYTGDSGKNNDVDVTKILGVNPYNQNNNAGNIKISEESPLHFYRLLNSGVVDFGGNQNNEMKHTHEQVNQGISNLNQRYSYKQLNSDGSITLYGQEKNRVGLKGSSESSVKPVISSITGELVENVAVDAQLSPEQFVEVAPGVYLYKLTQPDGKISIFIRNNITNIDIPLSTYEVVKPIETLVEAGKYSYKLINNGNTDSAGNTVQYKNKDKQNTIVSPGTFQYKQAHSDGTVTVYSEQNVLNKDLPTLEISNSATVSSPGSKTGNSAFEIENKQNVDIPKPVEIPNSSGTMIGKVEENDETPKINIIQTDANINNIENLNGNGLLSTQYSYKQAHNGGKVTVYTGNNVESKDFPIVNSVVDISKPDDSLKNSNNADQALISQYQSVKPAIAGTTAEKINVPSSRYSYKLLNKGKSVFEIGNNDMDKNPKLVVPVVSITNDDELPSKITETPNLTGEFSYTLIKTKNESSPVCVPNRELNPNDVKNSYKLINDVDAEIKSGDLNIPLSITTDGDTKNINKAVLNNDQQQDLIISRPSVLTIENQPSDVLQININPSPMPLEAGDLTSITAPNKVILTNKPSLDDSSEDFMENSDDNRQKLRPVSSFNFKQINSDGSITKYLGSNVNIQPINKMPVPPIYVVDRIQKIASSAIVPKDFSKTLTEEIKPGSNERGRIIQVNPVPVIDSNILVPSLAFGQVKTSVKVNSSASEKAQDNIDSKEYFLNPYTNVKNIPPLPETEKIAEHIPSEDYLFVPPENENSESSLNDSGNEVVMVKDVITVPLAHYSYKQALGTGLVTDVEGFTKLVEPCALNCGYVNTVVKAESQPSVENFSYKQKSSDGHILNVHTSKDEVEVEIDSENTTDNSEDVFRGDLPMPVL